MNRPSPRAPALRILVWLLGLAVLAGLPPSAAYAQGLLNTADGTLGEVALDATAAVVTLSRTGTVASAAIAEINPGRALGGTPVDFRWSVHASIGPGDVGYRELRLTPPPGFQGIAVTGITVDGEELDPALAQVDSLVRVVLPARVTRPESFAEIRFRAVPPETPGWVDFAGDVADGNLARALVAGDADGDPEGANDLRLEVLATQGVVLDLELELDLAEIVAGDVVRVIVPVTNRGGTDVLDVNVGVQLPPHLRIVDDAVWIDGVRSEAAIGASGVTAALGTVPGRVDANGNGAIDRGEPGRREIVFRAVVGSGARPGAAPASARAWDYCDTCFLAEPAETMVRFGVDPDFERSTLIGRVFEDLDGDGRVDADEPGVPFARLVLDDATIVRTDDWGRFHIPFVDPGQRLVKLDVASLGAGAVVLGEESRVVRVTPGLLARVNFPVRLGGEVAKIGREDSRGIAVVSLADDHGIDVLGNVGGLTVLVNGTEFAAPDVGLRRTTGGYLVHLDPADGVTGWSAEFLDRAGEPLAPAAGEGAPPARIEAPDGNAAAARLRVRYATGVTVSSAWAGDGSVIRSIVAPPVATIEGRPVPVSRIGRFAARVPEVEDRVRVELADGEGRSLEREITVPSVELRSVRSERIVASNDVVAAGLLGWTDPGNTVEVDGAALTLGPEGEIVLENSVEQTHDVHAVLIRSPEGVTRIVNLRVDRTDGVVVPDGIPDLELRLPPSGEPLPSRVLRVTGRAQPGSRVTANGVKLEVAEDGGILGQLDLERGSNRITFSIEDERGRQGTIEREFDVADDGLFLIAFADGEFGLNDVRGHLEGAGVEDGFYHEGRLAYYLEGRVRGRWLVKSAFDTGREEIDGLFSDLGPDETERLFRNLDPDRLYPVYGDASVVEYGAESQGKFYLAVSAEEGEALFGNYAVRLDDTELAQYRRTLTGGQIAYRSLARDAEGGARTQALVFGAEVGRVHVRNELRATGGSLYYLSHRDVVEGSEQVALVVRDKTTGLPLRRTVQQRDRDYTVKYPEGRIHFRNPVAMFESDPSLVDDELLSGHPVWVEVDLEVGGGDLSETALGARGSHRVGPVRLGGTHVDDPQAAGDYTLTAADAEITVAKGTRIVAEFAESSGSDARTYRSDDGGLAFREVSADATRDGTAWKIAAEVNAAAWGAPGLRLGGYYRDLGAGFASGLGSYDRATTKGGLHMTYEISPQQSLAARYEREEADGGMASRLGSARWSLKRGRFGWSAELEDRSGILDRTTAAAAVTVKPHPRWDAGLEHQQTVSGPGNRQTTLSVGYRMLDRLRVDARAMEGELGRAVQGGAELDLGDGRVYLNERVERTGRGTRRATVLGGESEIAEATRVYSEYRWERSPAEGERAVSLFGAGRRFDLVDGLRMVLGAEVSRAASGGGATDRSAATAGVRWDATGVEAETRNELRFDRGDIRSRQWVTDNRIRLAMSPDFSLVGKYRTARTTDRRDGSDAARLDEGSIGLAYRPVGPDRLNGLARYTRLLDRRPLELDGRESPERVMDVVSVEGVLEVTDRVQWYAKGAARVREDRDPVLPDLRTHTFLGIQRFDVTVRDPIDLGLEYRLLRQREADDVLHGWVTEASGRLRPRVRLGVGFNFTDFSDDEFQMNDYSVRGWFLRIQGKY